MRRTTLQHLGPDRRRRPPAGYHDPQVGVHDESKGEEGDGHGPQDGHRAVHRVGRTRELDDIPAGAVDLMDATATQRKPGHRADGHSQVASRTGPRQERQRGHGSGRHPPAVVQRVADGHVPVVRHDAEDAQFVRGVCVDDVDLGEAGGARDQVVVRQEVQEEPGEEAGRTVEGVDGEEGNEDVHGLVERLLLHDDADHGKVGGHNEGVDQQAEGEGRVTVVAQVHEHGEVEVEGEGGVLHPHRRPGGLMSANSRQVSTHIQYNTINTMKLNSELKRHLIFFYSVQPGRRNPVRSPPEDC